eukprot:jgi/Picre1/27518/NNA_000485.t1
MKKEEKLSERSSFEEADEEGDTLPSLEKKQQQLVKPQKVRKAVGGIPTPFDSAGSSKVADTQTLEHRWSSNLGFEHSRLPRFSKDFSIQCPVKSRTHSFPQSCIMSTALKWKDMRRRDVWVAFHVQHGYWICNEQVPLNNEGYVLPWYYRVLLRSGFVLFITLLACILPFFEAMSGLSGSITFFPLAIYFPFACYRALYPVEKKFDILLKVIWVFTLSVELLQRWEPSET